MSYFISSTKNPEISVLSCSNITGSANGNDPFYLSSTYVNGQFNPITGSDIVLVSGYEYFLEFVPTFSNTNDAIIALEVDGNIVNTGWTIGSSTQNSTVKNTLFYTYKPLTDSAVKMKIVSSAVNSTIVTDNTRLFVWRVV
jgi:hypothetical protein